MRDIEREYLVHLFEREHAECTTWTASGYADGAAHSRYMRAKAAINAYVGELRRRGRNVRRLKDEIGR